MVKYIIKMVKLDEDNNSASYLFHTCDEKKIINGFGESTSIIRRAAGILNYDKKLQKCFLDSEKTDNLFFSKHFLVEAICQQVIEMHKLNHEFPYEMELTIKM